MRQKVKMVKNSHLDFLDFGQSAKSCMFFAES
jgi:hypothetical protein